MFQIQGKTCTKQSSIQVTIKKKPIHLSLYINKLQSDSTPESFRITKTSPKFHSNSLNPDPMPHPSSPTTTALLSTKKLSQTPTPCKSPNIKYSYLNYEFDPPQMQNKRHSSHMSSDPPEDSSSILTRNRKGLHTGQHIKILKQPKRTEEKITMKDLKLNLPSIIKSKKYKRRSKYRPLISESFY